MWIVDEKKRERDKERDKERFLNKINRSFTPKYTGDLDARQQIDNFIHPKERKG